MSARRHGVEGNARGRLGHHGRATLAAVVLLVLDCFGFWMEARG